MEKINEFYKDILESLELIVTDTGAIMVKSGKSTLPLIIDGLSVVLPTAENIKNLISTVDGEPKLNYYLFNPAYEDPLKGTTKSIHKLRELMYRRIENKLVALMETLFTIVSDKENNTSSPGIIEFTELLLRYKNKAIKQMVDADNIKVLQELYTNSRKSTNPNDNFIHIFLAKGGKIGNENYNKISSTGFPLLDRLKDFKVKKDTINGIKLRNKDISSIVSAYEYIFSKENIENGIIIGSKNKISPSLHTLLITYTELIKDINNAIVSIEDNIDEELKDALMLNPLKINIEEMNDFLTSLEEDLKFIPKENDIELMLKRGTSVGYVQPQVQQVNQQAVQQPIQTSDPLDDILNAGVQPQIQQPMMVQDTPPWQQSVQQPMPVANDPIDAILAGGY